MDLVQLYLNEIGRIPLLTHEQEVAYGRQVQQMMHLLEAKKSLSEKLSREPTRQEWAGAVSQFQSELAQAIRAGQRARQKMVSANLGSVAKIGTKLIGYSL